MRLISLLFFLMRCCFIPGSDEAALAEQECKRRTYDW